MHAAYIDNLEKQLERDAQWKVQYQSVLGKAETIARSIHLIHVTQNEQGQFADMLLTPEKIEISTVCSAPNSNTRATEARFGLGSCAYYFAGRSYPKAGGVALAFAADCEASQHGNVTPFDTGGMNLGYIHFTPEVTEVAQVDDFVTKSMFDLNAWRDVFGPWLAAYCPASHDFWRGRPLPRDPEGVYGNARNNWRAWTPEVRFHKAQSIFSAAAYCASEPEMDVVRQRLLSATLSSDEETRLDGFLDKAIDIRGSIDYGFAAEEWVMRECGVL